MSKSKSTLVQDYFDAGYAAYRAGGSRELLDPPAVVRRFGLEVAWEAGWDAGLFEDAMKVGMAATADAICPYVHPETAAHWVQGWRIRHTFTVINGHKKPASRSLDAKPGC